MIKLKYYSLLVLGMVGLGQARTFTNTKGQEIDAEVVEIVGEKVRLKLKKNTESYLIDIDTLSAADQKFLKGWEKEDVSDEGAEKGEKEATDESKKDGAGAGFDEEWPDSVTGDRDIEIEVVKEDEEEKKYIYQSPNYEFVCDVKLSKTVVKKFAILFEATRDYCEALPIEMIKTHKKSEHRDKILLFESKQTYFKNGGPPGSAGVYMSGDNVVMVPLTSLGVKKVGSSYMFDYKGSSKTLPHEITHQLTVGKYYKSGARGWFSEGLAEYVGVTPYRSGRYNVKTNVSAIKEYATAHGEKGIGGRAIGEDIEAPDLKKYMLQSYSSFTANANFNYGLGMLITYYYFHMEEDRTAINNFLKSLKEGKEGEEALKILLNGRTWDEMEKAIYDGWKRKGVKINFK